MYPKVVQKHEEPNAEAMNQREKDRREEMLQYEKAIIPEKQMTFNSHHPPTETVKFAKEEIKEEVEEEEKELQRQRNDSQMFPEQNQDVENVEMESEYENDESNKSEDSENDPESGGEIIPQEDSEHENEQEIGLVIRNNMNNRNIPTGVNQANSFHTRAEVNSSVENLSATMPNIQIPNEFQNPHNISNNRRMMNPLIGNDSGESSDEFNGNHNHHHSRELLEEQIDSIKISFVHTISHERRQIYDTK